MTCPLHPLGYYRYWTESARKTTRNRILVILAYLPYLLSESAIFLLNKVDAQ